MGCVDQLDGGHMMGCVDQWDGGHMVGCVDQWDALQLHPIGYCGHTFVDKQYEQH